MRRYLLPFLATAAIAPATAYAEQGMWPRQARDISPALTKAGLKLHPAKPWDLSATPLNAIVSTGGCSAAFVSPDGMQREAEARVRAVSTVDSRFMLGTMERINHADGLLTEMGVT